MVAALGEGMEVVGTRESSRVGWGRWGLLLVCQSSELRRVD